MSFISNLLRNGEFDIYRENLFCLIHGVPKMDCRAFQLEGS